MYEVQTVYYGDAPLRTVQIEGKRWWVATDICRKVLGHGNFNHVLCKLADERKLKLPISRFGGFDVVCIDDAGLAEIIIRSAKAQAAEFKLWLESEAGLEFPAAPVFMKKVGDDSIIVKKDMSVASQLQRAQMLIRIAEHKAVPASEQQRLLELAAKELTGEGFFRVKEEDDMNVYGLPEVTGCVKDKIVEDLNGCQLVFLPVKMLSEKTGIPIGILNSDRFRTPRHGFWKVVKAPSGLAREFVYLDHPSVSYQFGESGAA